MIKKLINEIKKDIGFFGFSGLLAGFLMLLQYNLKQYNINPDDSLADALFSDFISFNAFGFIFIGLIILGAFSTLLKKIGIYWDRLDSLIQHAEERLTQLGSSIISFTIGLSAVAITHALCTKTHSGYILAFLFFLLDLIIITGFMTAMLITKEQILSERWWFPPVLLIVATLLLAYIMIYGVT